MKTVIYLDVLLLVNFLIGYLMLGSTALVTSSPVHFGRQLLGAALAALASLTILLPELSLPIQLAAQISTGLAVTLACFGHSHWRKAAFRFLCYCGCNLLLAALVGYLCSRGTPKGVETNNLSVYLYVSPRLLFWCSVLLYSAVQLWLRLGGGDTPPLRRILRLRLCGKERQLAAMLDTGLLMEDPLTLRPVILLSREQLEQFDQEAAIQLGSWQWGTAQSFPKGLRLLPCRTASGSGVLPAIPGEIMIEDRQIKILAAIAEKKFETEEIQAMFSPRLEAMLR